MLYSRMSKTALLFLVCLFGLSSQSSAQPPSLRRFKIKSVDSQKITYYIYNVEGEGTIDVSSLSLKAGTIGQQDPLNLYFYYPESIKLELLEKGMATLRDRAKATPEEIEAQEKATPPPAVVTPPEPGAWDRIKKYCQDVWEKFWKLILLLASLGILAPIGAKIYRETRIKKRMELLFAGDQAAGKSALFERLRNPTVSRYIIEHLLGTEDIRPHKGRPFPVGRYEVFPQFFDTPGSKPSLNIQKKKEFFASRVLVYVLAPSEKPGQDLKSSEALMYRSRQLGYMKVFLEVVLLTQLTVKPKIVVLFVNKFDLFSAHNPNDSQARIAIKEAQAMFSEHINLFNLVARQAELKPNIEFGSALEDWNCDKVKTHIEEALNYGT